MLTKSQRVPITEAVQCGTCSDTGRVRQNNEDSLRVELEMNLFVLSDGMGGASSGEIASRLTVDTVVAHCRALQETASLDSIGQSIEGVTLMCNRLADGIRLANRVVHKSAQENMVRQGMGATVVAVCCTGQRMCVAHVGDSRAYLFRGGHLQQLTTDHSLVTERIRAGRIVPEGDSSCDLHTLTRAVGADPEVEVDISEELLIQGDTVLLCSDGLNRELSDTQIAAILGEAKNVQGAADSLVRLAVQAGGGDNISVIVLRPSRKILDLFSGIGRLGNWFCGRSGQS